MILRNRLKERRAALNVNQQEMGALCGVSRQTISLIERGDYSPSVTLALTIAKVCGVTVEEESYAYVYIIGNCRGGSRWYNGICNCKIWIAWIFRKY